MKAVVYEDENGWLRRSLVLDEMSALEGQKGIPDGPPDVTELDWTQIAKELNNLLVKRNLLKLQDLKGQGINNLQNAVQVVITRKIIELYKSKEA